MTYEKQRAWSVLLRLYHWAFALSIVALTVTGFYINSPWTNTTLEGAGTFPVANMRYWHFVAGYMFVGAVLVRIYLFFFGNKQEKLWDALPVTPKNIVNLFKTIFYYIYVTENKEHRLGHNALALLIYLITLAAAVFQLLSGFYLLYPESAWWQSFGYNLFGPQQQARLVHHLLMWYFMIFAMIHIYLVIWNEVKSPEGLVSSIFSGDKFMHKES